MRQQKSAIESRCPAAMGLRSSLPRMGGWGVILSATLLFVLPVLKHNNLLPWGMDLSFACQMSQGMTQGLRDGNLYPRWVDSISRGLGGPAFVFYPPLAYYASSLVTMLSGDIGRGIGIVALGSAFLSGVAFFVAARPLSTELGAAVGAALYILLPYHVLDLYDRFAFAELTAFLWPPLLFRFVSDLAERPGWRAAFGLTMAFAGLMLTHLISAYLVLMALVPYGVFRTTRTRRWSGLAAMAGVGTAALLLCAVFLLPLLFERDLVHFERFTESFWGNWRRNFAFRDPVEFGFRPSEIKPAIDRCVASTGAFGLLLAGLFAVRFPGRVGTHGVAETRLHGWVFAALSAWVFFLQIPLSSFVWAVVPALGMAQFPWRFGLLQVLFASFQAACLLSPGPMLPTANSRKCGTARRTKGERVKGGAVALRALREKPAAALLAIVLAAMPALWFSVGITETRKFVFNNQLALERYIQSRVLEEYVPKTAALSKLSRLPAVVSPRAGVSGAGRVEVVNWTSHTRYLRVEANAPTEVFVATFLYPGWRALVDGKEVEIHPMGALGLIGLPVGAGTHEIEVAFGPTVVRRIGAWISAATALALLTLAAWLVLRQRLRVGTSKPGQGKLGMVRGSR
jgi:hypothetical protein